MAGQIFSQTPLDRENLKIRWKEPYVSDGLNRKFFGIYAKGIYAGFVLSVVGDRSVNIGPGSVSGGFGTGFQGGYVSGAFDESVGYSIAVQQSNQGVSKTLYIPPGPGSNKVMNLTGLEGNRVFFIIDSTYAVGQESTVTYRLVNGDYVNEDPSVIVIGHVDVPVSDAVPLDNSMIGYSDPSYPRLTPLATPQKPGFMPTSVWEKLDQFFAWEDLIKANVSSSNHYIIELKPSQRKTSGKKIYTYVDPITPSKFPRDASGKYNGGANDDQLTTLNILTGVIGGAHLVAGNTTFLTPSVSGTPDSFQMGLIALSAADQLVVSYGTVFASVSGATDVDNLPVTSGAEMPICSFLVETDAGGAIKTMTPDTSLLDRRPFQNFTNAVPANEEQVTSSGQSNFNAAVLTWSTSHTVYDVEVYVNGQRQVQSPTGALDKDFRKTSATQIQFSYTVPSGAVVEFRKPGAGTSTGGAAFNMAAVASDVLPDFSGARSLGNDQKGWNRLVLKDQSNSNLYEIVVVGGVMQVNQL